MKQLNVSLDRVIDETGYLFSFNKALSAAAACSTCRDIAEDIIASSGFAFRTWIADELCASETSVWDFGKQAEWLRNGGMDAEVAACCWQGDEALEAARRDILPKIEASIDRGVPVVAWDLGDDEWGLVTGYDKEARKLSTLLMDGTRGEMDYEVFGNRDMPMLNAVIIKGMTGKPQSEIIEGTKALAKAHLNGGEWSDCNPQGFAAYARLLEMINESAEISASPQMTYTLGTYAALKGYAWRFFEKHGEKPLAEAYKTARDAWLAAFEIKKTTNLASPADRAAVAAQITAAFEAEKAAERMM